jgi:hypothetical protein
MSVPPDYFTPACHPPPLSDLALTIHSLSPGCVSYYDSHHSASSRSVYHGSILRCLPHGTGQLTYSCGCEYSGTWLNGLFHGFGHFRYRNSLGFSCLFHGEFHKGQSSGQGTIIFFHTGIRTSVSAEGEFNHLFQLNGFGRWFLPCSNSFCYYEGNFSLGWPNGTGKLNDQNTGNCYQGQVKQGEFHGIGTMKYSNQAVWTGEWLSDQRHGWGLWLWPGEKVAWRGKWNKNKLTKRKIKLRINYNKNNGNSSNQREINKNHDHSLSPLVKDYCLLVCSTVSLCEDSLLCTSTFFGRLEISQTYWNCLTCARKHGLREYELCYSCAAPAIWYTKSQQEKSFPFCNSHQFHQVEEKAGEQNEENEQKQSELDEIACECGNAGPCRDQREIHLHSEAGQAIIQQLTNERGSIIEEQQNANINSQLNQNQNEQLIKAQSQQKLQLLLPKKVHNQNSIPINKERTSNYSSFDLDELLEIPDNIQHSSELSYTSSKSTIDSTLYSSFLPTLDCVVQWSESEPINLEFFLLSPSDWQSSHWNNWILYHGIERSVANKIQQQWEILIKQPEIDQTNRAKKAIDAIGGDQTTKGKVQKLLEQLIHFHREKHK